MYERAEWARQGYSIGKQQDWWVANILSVIYKDSK